MQRAPPAQEVARSYAPYGGVAWYPLPLFSTAYRNFDLELSLSPQTHRPQGHVLDDCLAARVFLLECLVDFLSRL